MTIISLIITESDLPELVSGIPISISISTNIPSTIFYTLDKSTPTIDSLVYTGPIIFPTSSVNSVQLNVFATDGTNSSPIITKNYRPNTLGERRPYATVSNPNDGNSDNFPFGDMSPDINEQYGAAGGLTVNDPDVVDSVDGYGWDGFGNPAATTDKPWPLGYEPYVIQSETDSEGNDFKGAPYQQNMELVVNAPIPISASSNTSSPFFNPRAPIIFQSFDKPSFDNIPLYNHQLFNLPNPNGGGDDRRVLLDIGAGGNFTGSALKPQYNPTTNTITYYYRDNKSNRWIMSTEKYAGFKANVPSSSLYTVFGRAQGSNFVYNWRPYASRSFA